MTLAVTSANYFYFLPNILLASSNSLSFSATTFSFFSISVHTSVNSATALTHSQRDLAATLIYLISLGSKFLFDAIFPLILLYVDLLILYTFNFYNRDKKLGSAIYFLILSQSSFSSNKIATHSKVNLTKACGLLLFLISAISPLLSVSNALTALSNTGLASFKI